MERFLELFIVRRYHSGICLVTNYHPKIDGGEDVQAVIMAALDRYCVSNPLHPDVFPCEYIFSGQLFIPDKREQLSARWRQRWFPCVSECELRTTALKLLTTPIGTTIPMVAASQRVVVQNLSSCRAKPIANGPVKSRVSLNRKCSSRLIVFDNDWLLSRIIPSSAHAAFDKAGHYFHIKIVHVPVDPITRQVNVSRMKRAMYVA